MRQLNHESVEIALIEAIRLNSIEGFSDSFKQIIAKLNIAGNEQAIYSDALWSLYRDNGSNQAMFLNDGQTRTNYRLLTQFLLIADICTPPPTKPQSLNELKTLLSHQEIHRGILNEWSEGFLAVIYQERSGIIGWIDYVPSAKGDWDELHILDNSLPYCSVSLDAILHYLELAVTHQANDMAMPLLGNNITLKIAKEPILKTEIEKNIDTIISRESARRFLPSFIRGIVNNDAQKFQSCLEQYSKTYQQFCNEFLWALGAACPKEEACQSAYKQALDEKLKEEKISRPQYINLSTNYLFKNMDTISLATNFANEASSTEDLNSLIGFLVMHIDENKSDWFQTIAGSIVQVDDDKIVNYLTHLFYQLVKQNVELSYLLITKRFESLGRKNFLESFWHELVNQNHELFHEQLTKWFNAENRNIHSAILKLTSLSEIHEHDFALSEKVLTTINSSEKLYVAMKIAGYMYSKEHLQSLIISLVRSVKEDEANLLAELYDIFYSYVIYNYRSTLDMISEEAKKENTPSHIANFYDQLEKAYEIYFQNFSLIKSHSELSHDSPLSQHLQYYKQQQLSVGLKESQKHSFMDSMKKVQLHSNNWASRNSSENQHHIRTLEKFGISVEFPAGEIYNPILQESKRRLYQRIKKHEINID